MTVSKNPNDYQTQGRRDRLIRELEHDPYHLKRKIKSPAFCSECGAVFQDGRWSWGTAPSGAHKALCPACHRIEDKVPAAFLTLGGDFWADHKDEIMNLIRNYEEREKSEHPLKRIISVEKLEDALEIKFTDAHLARGIGEALHDAYKGELDYHYTDEDIMLRVMWSR